MPLEESEFTYSNMTSFLAGMGVGPYHSGSGAAAMQLVAQQTVRAKVDRWDDPLGVEDVRVRQARQRGEIEASRARCLVCNLDVYAGVRLSAVPRWAHDILLAAGMENVARRPIGLPAARKTAPPLEAQMLFW